LSEEEIRYLYNRGAPIAHWKFDEGKGNIAYDSSGNGNNGTLLDASSTNADGNTPPQWVSGKFGSALRLDGVDDYVDGLPTSQVRTKGTLAIWINPSFPSNDTTNRWIVDRGVDADTGFWFGTGEWNGGNDVFFAVMGNSPMVQVRYPKSEIVPWENTWHHLVIVWEDRGSGSSYIALFVDGKKVRERNDATLPDVLPNAWIGAPLTKDPADQRWWRGLIDDVRIYNYARTPEQILQDYNAGLSAHFK
jgi:hypothetical protein